MSFYLERTMTIIDMASKYGSSVREMSVCQRLTPLDSKYQEPPCGLVWYWFVGYVLVVVHPTVAGKWMALLLSVGCILAAARAVWNKSLQRRKQLRWQKICSRYGYLFTPQGGEMTKEDRRAKWLKNKTYNSKEKRNWEVRSRRKKKSSKKTTQRVYVPQVGDVSMGGMKEAFSKLAGMNNIPFDDDVMDKIENLGAIYTILREAVSTPQMCASLFLFFKATYKGGSIAYKAAEYLANICDLEFSSQTGEFTSPKTEDTLDAVYDTQTGTFSSPLKDKDKPKWLQLLKECKENWTLVIRNEGFTKISHILSLSIALGLCEASSLDFKVGGMKMFSIGAVAKQASCIDLIDAVFETVVYFAEGGYACFERGTIKPLLYGNMENEEFEENYGRCQQCHDYARAGNLALEGLDENDYEQLLCATIEKCNTMIQTSRGSVEKNVLRRKLDALRVWQSSFRQTRVQGGLREAPYSIGVFGGTGVGKSSVANILMVTTLLHNDYRATDDRVITLNESDKYMSNYRSYINGILIDDIGNTKAEFVEKAPTTLMIQLVNNVRMYANMAEAELKGKVSVEPKVVIGTKNVKDTCATVYSNEPASIARRDRRTITVEVREPFRSDGMLDADKVRAFYGHQIPLIPDLWEITVEHAYPVPNPTKGKSDLIGWKTINWGGAPLEKISLKHFVRYVAEDSKGFYIAQKQLVENQSNLALKMKLCETCRLVQDVCICPPPVTTVPIVGPECPNGYCEQCEGHHHEEVVLDNQFGLKIAGFLHQKCWTWSRRLRPKLDYWLNETEERSVEWLIKRLDWLENSPYTVWTNWVPTEWMSRDFMKNLVWLTNETELRARIRKSYRNHLICLFFIIAFAFHVHNLLIVYAIIPLLCMCRVVEVEKKRLYDEVSAENEAMPQIFKMYRDRHVKWITGVCVTIAAIYAVAQIWKALRVIPTPQGNLAPTGDKEIEERDSEVNPWAGVVVEPMPCQKHVKNTTVDQLQAMVAKNIAYMEIRPKGSEKVYECNAFFPCSNVAIVPNHMWLADDLKCKFTRHDPEKIGGNFEAWLCRRQSYHIPKTDLSVVWVPNGGDWKDLTKFLPEKAFAAVPARLVYKKESGNLLELSSGIPKLFMQPKDVLTKACSFFGAEYKLGFNTFEGLCMATIVTETKGPLIGGFHLGGVNGHVNGCSGLLTSEQFTNAMQKLKETDGVVLSKSEGEIPQKLYDIQFFQNADVHPRSAVNFLEKGSNCKFYGQVIGRSTYHSSVEPTVISEHVEAVTGVPQKWGGPKFRKGYPFQASLVYSTKPSCGLEGTLVIRAAKDYLYPILKSMKRLKQLSADIRPLTEMEVVCGIDGKRFIDKMPPNTSVGFPLSGAKSKFLTELPLEEYPSHQYPVELDAKFWDMAKSMEELYLSGKRAYPIFKACLKDEPTKLTKDKVRVFQGAPIALQLLVRKYFLPAARFLSMIPLTSECAVGVNASGPEWDQLAKHMKKYGDDRILAGDYSKYDLRMSAQLMFAAFRVMMDIAKSTSQYSEDDLTIMEGIATDICYPLMAYNGDLVQHFGSNPSGQNLTVYVNSIVNSLLMRCAYFEIMKERNPPPFREVCALMTYGDDVKSSVKEGFDQFNHISVAQFLENRDMKFTMPDKESEPTPYMKDDEADFLKRKNVYNPDTDCIMGALDQDSKFKSLHAVLHSKAVTGEQQAMQNIDGFLRESFPYGEEYYEQRRTQMREIAERADLAHGCLMLDTTYEDNVLKFKEKYQ